MTACPPLHVPHAIRESILGSLGGALAVAAHLAGLARATLEQLARGAFMSGMDLGMTVGAAVALAGVVLALIALPSRAATRDADPTGAPPGSRGSAGGRRRRFSLGAERPVQDRAREAG